MLTFLVLHAFCELLILKKIMPMTSPYAPCGCANVRGLEKAAEKQQWTPGRRFIVSLPAGFFLSVLMVELDVFTEAS